MAKRQRLQDEYRFAGARPLATVRGVFGDPMARIVVLVRRRKKRLVGCVGGGTAASTIGAGGWYAICRAVVPAFTWRWKSAGWRAEGAAQ